MNFKYPWLISRRRLICSLLIDATLFIFFYYSLYKTTFDEWPFISVRTTLLFLFWLLMSYTIGRYSLTTSRYALDIYTQIGRQILLSFLTLIGSLFAILIGILFFGQETVQIGFQQFLFNHAIIISIFSFVFKFCWLNIFYISILVPLHGHILAVTILLCGLGLALISHAFPLI